MSLKPTKLLLSAALVPMATSGCSSNAHTSAPPTSVRSAPLNVAATLAPTTAAAPTTVTTTLPPTTVIDPVATSTTRAVTTTTPAAPTAAASVAACPASLASHLASTGRSLQLITVEAAGWDTSEASVELWSRSSPTACWTPVAGPWPSLIGQNGFSNHHIEGDGTTPTGMYGVGPVMYGNAPNPGVHETYVSLKCGDWWDEDPSSPEYNTYQVVPCGTTPSFKGGSEALWEETAPYPSFAVIDYNTGPIVSGAGSAIFFHADTGEPTTGCVSVPRADLDETLRWLQPGDDPVFVMGPAGQITSF